MLPGPTDSTQLLPPTAQNDPQLYGGAARFDQPKPTQVMPTAPTPGYWSGGSVATPPVSRPAPMPAHTPPPPARTPPPQPSGQPHPPPYQQQQYPQQQAQAWPQTAQPARPTGPSQYNAGPRMQAGPEQPTSVYLPSPPAPPSEPTQDWSDPDSEGQPKAVLYGVLGAAVIAVAVIGGLLYFGTPSGPATTPAAASTTQSSAEPSATATPTSSSQLQLPPPPPTTAPPTTQPPSAPTGPITGYQGMCVDDRSGAAVPGNPVLIASCDSGSDQAWSVASGNTLQAFGMCMDVAGGATADATTIDLYTCNGTGAQVWEPQANGSLFNPQSNKCLDDTGFGGSGTQLQIWDCTGGPNQVWALP